MGISDKAFEKASDKPEEKLVLPSVKTKSSAEELGETSADQTSAACCVKPGYATECNGTLPVSHAETWYRKLIRRIYIQLWLTFVLNLC